jgi:hypothetical protein
MAKIPENSVARLSPAEIVRHALATVVSCATYIEDGDPGGAHYVLLGLEDELEVWLSWNEKAEAA